MSRSNARSSPSKFATSGDSPNESLKQNKAPKCSTPGEKRLGIPKRIRRIVWNTHCGEIHAKGSCFICEAEIDIQEFHAGHILATSRGGPNTPENLRPLCAPCNQGMGAQHMRDYVAEYHPERLSILFPPTSCRTYRFEDTTECIIV
jgi:hypothetical protein